MQVAQIVAVDSSEQDSLIKVRSRPRQAPRKSAARLTLENKLHFSNHLGI